MAVQVLLELFGLPEVSEEADELHRSRLQEGFEVCLFQELPHFGLFGAAEEGQFLCGQVGPHLENPLFVVRPEGVVDIC